MYVFASQVVSFALDIQTENVEFPLSPLAATSPSLLVLLKLFALIVFAEQHSSVQYAVSCSCF